MCIAACHLLRQQGVYAVRCMQAFDGADIIVHELGDNVTLANLRERPAAVQDDRVAPAARLTSSRAY